MDPEFFLHIKIIFTSFIGMQGGNQSKLDDWKMKNRRKSSGFVYVNLNCEITGVSIW
jgi:hypothetical protein